MRGHREESIVLDRVVRSFGAKVAVDGVSFSVRQGEVYGLIGPNGAGKTTTFSMMAGYLAPSAGTLRILGVSPSATSVLRGRLGVLPQDALLPPADQVGEFLVHLARLQGLDGPSAARSAKATLEELGGASFWNLKCGALSHGMAKRVALAQALMGTPEVVFLDEPTAGLDPKSAHEVRDVVRSRKGKTTIVVSSHNLQELEEICDGAVILDRGRTAAQGTIEELTGASGEIVIAIRDESSADPPWIEAVRAASHVRRVTFDAGVLVVAYSPEKSDAESVIGEVLGALLANKAKISGVAKGRGLEQKVIALTAR